MNETSNYQPSIHTIKKHEEEIVMWLIENDLMYILDIGKGEVLPNGFVIQEGTLDFRIKGNDSPCAILMLSKFEGALIGMNKHNRHILKKICALHNLLTEHANNMCYIESVVTTVPKVIN